MAAPRRRRPARPAPRRGARPPAALPLARVVHLARAQAPGSAARSRARCCGVSAGRPRRRRISSRTTGVAVAVQARTRAPGSSASRPPISRYSGRKSWPHSLMQWASSMATSGHGDARLSSPRKPGEGQPLRRDVDDAVGARREPRHAPARPRRRRGSRRGTSRATPRASSACDLVVHQRDERRDDEAWCRGAAARGAGS